MAVTEARDTREAILDAALDGLARVGMAKLSLGEVARSAAVSRQTLYRYFRDREDLITAVILREEAAFMAAMAEAGARHSGLREALEAVIVTLLSQARGHPLLDRLLASEPEALLPFLTTNRAPVVGSVRPLIEELVATRLGNLSVARVRTFADALARLLVSYTVNPPEVPVEVVAAGLADIFTRGLDT